MSDDSDTPSRARRTLPGREQLDARARALLEHNWRSPGFTAPNEYVYPHQWLWDSCFHAVVWSHLGASERAVQELANALAHQGEDGFVPHMTYWADPDAHAAFWGRRTTSCITQPPMYGHAIAELVRCGAAVPDELVARAVDGIVHLGRRRADEAQLVPVLHPWETGCDDSPRWDAWCPGGWEPHRWRARKGELVEALDFAASAGARAGSAGPVGSSQFAVGSAAFTALVAFNAAELHEVTGASALEGLHRSAAAALADAWDPHHLTWRDVTLVPPGEDPVDVPIRTLEALLPSLVADEASARQVHDQLADTEAFGAPFGPTQVHRQEPSFEPGRYWRGGAWPQLTYLFWFDADRRGHHDAASRLRRLLVGGAVRSGFAEYWHPDTGDGLGARPQSWTALAAVVDAAGS